MRCMSRWAEVDLKNSRQPRRVKHIRLHPTPLCCCNLHFYARLYVFGRFNASDWQALHAEALDESLILQLKQHEDTMDAEDLR